MVPSSIRFSTDIELSQVISDFETLGHLQHCAGALDGTFMRIEKPLPLEMYILLQQFHGINILGCGDVRGSVTSGNSGRPGLVEDIFLFNRSSLKRYIDSEKWLSLAFLNEINGQDIKPFLVADAAFSLSRTVLRCYNGGNVTAQQSCFSYSVIRTRRVVK